MNSEGKQLLREHIRNKRTSEGLEGIPEDLFAEKPRQEMSGEEMAAMQERRKRNKEAAERSRKKKKVEFEKLQNENDQLNQDKCELVAMVHKLKTDINHITKENETLRISFDQLKRWIGKRAFELGLTKFNPKEDVQDRGNLTKTFLMLSPRNDPSLNTSIGSVVTDDAPVMFSKSRAASPKSPSPPLGPQGDHYQPVIRPQLQTPWLVEPVASEKQSLESDFKGMAPKPLGHNKTQLPEYQPLKLAQGQQVICVPKDAIFWFRGDNQAVVAGAPELQDMTATSKTAVETPEVQNQQTPRISSTMAVLPGNTDQSSCRYAEETAYKGTSVHDIDSATATAIDSLLKLGIKVRMP